MNKNKDKVELDDLLFGHDKFTKIMLLIGALFNYRDKCEKEGKEMNPVGFAAHYAEYGCLYMIVSYIIAGIVILGFFVYQSLK